MKPKLIHIVAMDQNRCIGVGDNLPWHLPSDLEWFKAQTTGKTSIVGRKTFDSLPKSVQNDVKRTFIVCSRGPQGNDLTDVCNFPLPHPTTSQEVMTIIGGADVYNQTLHLTDELLITEVMLEVDGDKFYPAFEDRFKLKEFSPWQEENDITFRFTRWVRA